MTRVFIVFIAALLIAGAPARAAEVKEVVSPGGFTAWLVEEHALPLVAVKIAFRDSGFAHDASGKEGRAAITASMLMEGAGELDSRAFNEALESYAIELGVSADEDDFMVVMESLSEHKEKAFSYLGLALTRPRFDADAVERIRAQFQSALVRQEEEPGYHLSRAWKTLAYGSHPYANPEIGTAQSVKAMSVEDLRFVTGRYLTKENIVIAAVGDITPDELKLLIDQYLGDLPARFDPDITVSETALPKGKPTQTIEFNIPQTMLTFGVNGVKRSDPDYFAAYVMNQILGGSSSLTARLGHEIREKRGLAYSVYSYVNPMSHAASWQGGFATRNEQALAARDVLVDTLRKFVAEGPSEQEVIDAKRFLTGSFVLNLDSNADIASFLISMQLHKLGIDYLERRNKLIEAVTREDVHAIAKRLIDPDGLLIAMVGKPAPAKSQ
jgi:zinc protease